MNIGRREVAESGEPFIIAELGVNHDGSPQRALGLVDAAHRAGADAVKFQLFRAELLLSKAARLAAYQRASGATDPLAMLRSLELSISQMEPAVAHARALGLAVIVTVFSLEQVEESRAIAWDAYKTASPDIINRPLLTALMACGLPLLVSTGAATLGEVVQVEGWLGSHPHVLLQCVSAYPTPDEHASIAGRAALRTASRFAWGYSDHTTSIDTGALAVAAGATVLEKHLTWNRDAIGPDHAASLDEAGFAEYVRLARRAAMMLGPCAKRVLEIEQDVRTVSRQSLTTTRRMRAGEALSARDLTVRRPGIGLPPTAMSEVVGRTLVRNVDADMPLLQEDLA